MEKAQYQLVICFPFQAIDDISARSYAATIYKSLKIEHEAKIKLQKIFSDKNPQKLACDFDTKG